MNNVGPPGTGIKAKQNSLLYSLLSHYLAKLYVRYSKSKTDLDLDTCNFCSGNNLGMSILHLEI